MKPIKTISLVFLSATLLVSTSCQKDELPVFEQMIDDRDGHEYQTVQIGDQIWMAENLSYLPAVSLSSDGSVSEPHYYVYGYEGSSVTEAMTTTNYATYGVLYNSHAANRACPVGWHLPNMDDWKILLKVLGMNTGKKLKSTTGWNQDGNGNDQYGFNGLPGGKTHPAIGFQLLGEKAYFWEMSSDSYSVSWFHSLFYNKNHLGNDWAMKNTGMSVRCIKD